MSAQKTNDRAADETPKGSERASRDGRKNGDAGWAEQLKKVAYGLVGAVNVSPDDVKGVVSKLVEKGEIARKDGEKIFREISNRLKKTVKEPKSAVADVKEELKELRKDADAERQRLAKRIEASVERVLHTMNIATRRDVEDLVSKIDELDRKLERIVDVTGAAEQASPPAPAPAA